MVGAAFRQLRNVPDAADSSDQIQGWGGAIQR
jgi:hypothetical protein